MSDAILFDYSYVSFQTNTPLDNYNPLIRNVLSVFRPKRFVLTLLELEACPTDLKKVVVQSVSSNRPTRAPACPAPWWRRICAA